MDDQPQDESESVTRSTDQGSNEDLPFNPSPEVLFLIKSHAKAISAINNISKKLEQLEVKVCDISKQSSRSSVVSSDTTKSCHAIDSSKCHHSCAAHVLSDDSGGEYSRSTTNGTATDEDELMSLLDQIGKCSQSIRETRQVVNQSSHSRAIPLLDGHLQTASQFGNNQRLTSASGHPQTKTALCEGFPSPAINQSIGVPPIAHHPFNPPQHVSWNQRPHHHHTPSTSQHSSTSLNALLFDPNVSRILNSLSDELIEDPDKFLGGAAATAACPVDSVASNYHLPLTGSVIQSSRPFQRSLPTHHNSHESNRIPASIATSPPVSHDRGSRKWEMDRALQLVQKRSQDTVDIQYDMADQWLARQMKSKSHIIPVTSSSRFQGSSVSTVTLRSPSSLKTQTSQIPSTTGISGQKVTINSARPSSSQIPATSSNNSSSSTSTDIRHSIVNSSNNSRQQNVRSYHHSTPVTTTSDHSSSQSGLKGVVVPSVADTTLGSSLRKQAPSPSSRYTSSNSNPNYSSSKR